MSGVRNKDLSCRDRTMRRGDMMITLLSIHEAALHCNRFKHLWPELLVFWLYIFSHSHTEHIVVVWCYQYWRLAFFRMSALTAGSLGVTEESIFILSFTICLFTAQTQSGERDQTHAHCAASSGTPTEVLRSFISNRGAEPLASRPPRCSLDSLIRPASQFTKSPQIYNQSVLLAALVFFLR